MIYVYIYTYIYMYVCMYVCMYGWVDACMHVYVYIYTYTHYLHISTSRNHTPLVTNLVRPVAHLTEASFFQGSFSQNQGIMPFQGNWAFHSHGGIQKMVVVYFMENPSYKWMMTRGTPILGKLQIAN